MNSSTSSWKVATDEFSDMISQSDSGLEILEGTNCPTSTVSKTSTALISSPVEDCIMTQESLASPQAEDANLLPNENHVASGIAENALVARPLADTLTSVTLNKTAASVDAVISNQSTLRTASLNQYEGCYLKRPRFRRGLIWSPIDASFSPTACSTEYADPVPTAPSYLANSDAAHTVAAHPELFKIVTPINVDRFQALLVNHPNQPFVLSVCRALREGFWPWADASDEDYPSINDNSMRTCSKTDRQQKFIDEQLEEEIRLERVSESFGTELLPGMYSVPMHTVPKTKL